MNKKYEFTLNIKLKDLNFKHTLTDLFPHGEEIIFKSKVIDDKDLALEAIHGFADDLKDQLSEKSGLNLSTQSEPNPGNVESDSTVTWQQNEVLKVWVLDMSTNQPYALAQLMEV